MRKTRWDQESSVDGSDYWLVVFFSRKERRGDLFHGDTRILDVQCSLPGGTSNMRVCTFFEELHACSLADLPFLLPNNIGSQDVRLNGIVCPSTGVVMRNSPSNPKLSKEACNRRNQFVFVFQKKVWKNYIFLFKIRFYILKLFGSTNVKNKF